MTFPDDDDTAMATAIERLDMWAVTMGETSTRTEGRPGRHPPPVHDALDDAKTRTTKSQWSNHVRRSTTKSRCEDDNRTGTTGPHDEARQTCKRPQRYDRMERRGTTRCGTMHAPVTFPLATAPSGCALIYLCMMLRRTRACRVCNYWLHLQESRLVRNRGCAHEKGATTSGGNASTPLAVGLPIPFRVDNGPPYGAPTYAFLRSPGQHNGIHILRGRPTHESCTKHNGLQVCERCKLDPAWQQQEHLQHKVTEEPS